MLNEMSDKERQIMYGIINMWNLNNECTGQSKHPLPITQRNSTHGHHQMVNTKIRLITFFAAKNGEVLYSQQKLKETRN